MFGRAKPAAAAESRPCAEQLARLRGGGLVQAIVTDLSPLTYFLFLNDKPVDQLKVAGLYVRVEAPSDALPDGLVQATLSVESKGVDGATAVEDQQLFPCTLEVVALGRRLAVTATTAGSLDGLWVDLGLRTDGAGNRIEGLKLLELALQDEVFFGRLTWSDDTTEDLFPDPRLASDETAAS